MSSGCAEWVCRFRASKEPVVTTASKFLRREGVLEGYAGV